MITLNGASGKGTLWGTAYLPDRETSGINYVSQGGHLDNMLPPCDWFLPPPGGLWHPVAQSAYGPRLATIDVGHIVSTSKDSLTWNPCTHSTITGAASYRGLNDTLGPYWTQMASPSHTSFCASVENQKPVRASGQFLATMSGRPCTSSNTKVFGYNGIRVNQNISASGDAQRYWYYNSNLCANIAPLSVRSSLSQYGTLHANGLWYGRNVSNTLIVPGQEHNNAFWYNVTWDRPDRTTFVRDMIAEYHTPTSYTPQDSRGKSEIDFLGEANHRITTFVITHVKSDTAGRFWIKYDITTDLTWFGYKFPSKFSGSKKVTTRGLECCLLILEPGLTTEFIPDLTLANDYCANAGLRAKLLYDPSIAKQARTAAVMDVQELDSNWIENLSGLKGTTEVINPLIDGAKAVKAGNVEAARKALAGAYLVYSYAVAPSISDVGNIKDDGSRILSLATRDRFSNERRRGAASLGNVPVCATRASTNYFTTLHLRLKNNYFSQLWAALEKFGIEPTASQMWDLVPFSFVVDWFGKVGESLSRLDQYNSLVLNRDLLGRIESFKVQWPLEKEVINYLFDNMLCSSGKPLAYSWYDRRVHYDIGSIDPIAISQSDGLSQNQMAQGAALLTQMKR